MHNNERYFPNPKKFNPDRFANREADKNNHNSFLPFSAGPRNCLGKACKCGFNYSINKFPCNVLFYSYFTGQKFAMLEMKVVLTEVLLHYQLLPAEKIKSLTIETGIVLRSLENMPVRLSRRE